MTQARIRELTVRTGVSTYRRSAPSLANHSRRVAIRAIAGLAAAACAGCGPTPTVYVRPELDLPPATARVAIEAQWWTTFGDPLLDRFVEEALRNNYDLAKAAANVAEARANAGVAHAMLFPRVDGQARSTLSRRQLVLGQEEEFDQRVSATSIGALLSWEVDLWGRIKNLNNAALAQWAASEHVRDATQLSISQAVAETYFQLRNFENKLAITRDTHDNLKSVADFELRRWKAQVGTAQAYRQSVAEVAAVAAQIPVLQAAVARTELALALLIGRSPRGIAEALPRPRQAALHIPDTPREIDSDLLMRRPDVASAEQLLLAAHADLDSVRAEYYPRLTISLAGGWIGSSSALVTGMPFFWQALGNLAGPIFDAGTIDWKVEGAEARRQQAIAHYRYVVSSAFREAYEALVLIDAGDRQAIATAEAVAARKEALALDERSYEVGRTSKYEVLAQTIRVLNAELTLADARLNQLVARSQYYKALGGGL